MPATITTNACPMATTAMIVEEKSRFSRLILVKNTGLARLKQYTGDHDDCEETQVLNQLKNRFSVRGLSKSPACGGRI